LEVGVDPFSGWDFEDVQDTRFGQGTDQQLSDKELVGSVDCPVEGDLDFGKRSNNEGGSAIGRPAEWCIDGSVGNINGGRSGDDQRLSKDSSDGEVE